MNTCIRCNEAPTASALCAPCKAATRAAISAYTRPIFEARAAIAVRERETARRSFAHARNAGA